MKRLDINISGIVQGVGFRAYTTRTARSLGLKGYVENLSDGRVHAVAEGPKEKLEELIDRVKEGPPASQVDNVETREEEPTGEFQSFHIRR